MNHGQHHRCQRRWRLSLQVQSSFIAKNSDHSADLPRLGLHVVGWTDSNGCVSAPFGPEFDNFELGNRYVRGRGIGRRSLLYRQSASLACARLPKNGDFSTLSLVFHSKQDTPLPPFFLQCYSFLLNPPSFYPHFLTPHRAILPFRPLLHAPIALQQPRLPPSTCPSPPALSFLRLGHDRPSKPAHRRICLRLCPKRAYPFPCPDAKANMPPWVLHRTP